MAIIDFNNTNESGLRITFLSDPDRSPVFDSRDGQTITPTTSYLMTSVKLLLSRYIQPPVDLDPRTIKVSLYATDDDGKPTGSILSSDTTDGDTLPRFNSDGSELNDDPDREWVEFDVAWSMLKDVKYALVLSIDGAPISGADRYIQWWRSSSQYSGGGTISGFVEYPATPDEDDWDNSLEHLFDFLFETLGVIPAVAQFPEVRPTGYDEEQVWNPTGGDDSTGGFTSDPWDLTTLGGGRYKRSLVVVGHKKIYVGDI